MARAAALLRRVTLAIWMAGAAGGCSTNILHGVDETTANETVAALERAGIGAEKSPGENAAGAAFSVRVSSADQARALELLRSLGLPRHRRQGFAEVYGQPSLIPTASEERARYLEALGGEVARTLETAEGVVSARVHLVLAENDPLGVEPQRRTPARAAVLMKVRPGGPPLSEADVQKLVAGSVAGLDASSVAVVMTAAPGASDGGTVALAAVGPLRVAPGSRPLLLAVVAIGLGLLGLLAAMLLVTARRLAALERLQPPKP
jgi:type III secretion protein J